ncbi:uncharacterized protein [Ptychodera flava]|uniref:uncharacterized protein n=1 Tax=Ptychodera flava TaxID=63121 RepID=UPI003969E6AF
MSKNSVYVLLVLYHIITEQATCDSICQGHDRWQQRDVSFVDGFSHYLDNHLIFQTFATSILDCVEICQTSGESCQSVNYWRRQSLCQINDADNLENGISEDYKAEHGAVYVPRNALSLSAVETLPRYCASEPCLNGATCKEDCSVHNYICLCTAGYTGNNCQYNSSVGTCADTAFTCIDGTCIDPSHQCDYFQDCSDRDDEENCTCSADDFQCADGKCIPSTRRCDGIRDCLANDDENNCTALPADCPVLSSPTNGDKEGSVETHGSVAKFSCDAGYTMVGPSVLVCLDGSWHSNAPTCHANCNDPGSPMNGESFGSTNHSNSLYFSCMHGFTMIGQYVIHCIDGSWSSIVPTCYADCVDPGIPDNGTRSGSLHHSNNVTYSCDAGYIMYGTSTSTCNMGTWTDTAPSCFDLTPYMYWDLSGKCALADPNPTVSCPGVACSSIIYANIGDKSGTINRSFNLTSSPFSRQIHHTCVVHFKKSNWINFGDMDGTCLADQSQCSNGITISFWLYFDTHLADNADGNPVNPRYIVSSGGQTGNGRGVAIFVRQMAPPRLECMVRTIKSKTKLNVYSVAKDNFPSAEWFHVTMTFHPINHLFMYFDGVQQTPDIDSHAAENTADHKYTNFAVGADSVNPSNDLGSDASISDLKVFYRALSSQEIDALYQYEAAGN